MSDVSALLRRSVEIIREGQPPTGAYLACPAFEPYRYSWFRDGSFIADAMSRVGEIESAEAFFDWCARVIVARRREIEAGERLDTRFTVDGDTPQLPWASFQLDGYGLWLWALREHCGRHDRSPAPYAEAIELTRAYIARHWREPCFDWWEEREDVHPATIGCLAAGLRAWGDGLADEVAAALPPLAETRPDASLLVLATPFGFWDGDVVELVEKTLASPDGGVHRNLEDEYYGGGEWLLLSALLGWAYAERGDEDRARAKLDWVARHATPAGELPEQSQDHLLRPDRFQPWVERWGPPASPLLWSHAMFLALAAALAFRP